MNSITVEAPEGQVPRRKQPARRTKQLRVQTIDKEGSSASAESICAESVYIEKGSYVQSTQLTETTRSEHKPLRETHVPNLESENSDVGVDQSRSSRYNLRPRPRRDRNKRARQTKQVEESLQTLIIREDIQEEEEEEEEQDAEITEITEAESSCARVDFVYDRNSRGYSLVQVPAPIKSPYKTFWTGKTRTRRGGERLYVWSSRIHGKGLFTHTSFAKRQKVLDFVGEVVRSPVASVRQDANMARGEQSCYMFEVGEGLVIDSTRKGGMGRFINHCCVPNAEAKSKDGKVYVQAIRDIGEEEEITMNYGGQGETGKCFCGVEGCKGVLTV